MLQRVSSILKKQLGKKGPKAAPGKRVLSWAAVEMSVNWINTINSLLDCQERAATTSGFWLRDFHKLGEFPIILECYPCSWNSKGGFDQDFDFVYFKYNPKTGNYEEDPEVYIAMRNPESRKLQEMLADRASLQDRYDQYIMEQLKEEKAAKKQLPTQIA